MENGYGAVNASELATLSLLNNGSFRDDRCGYSSATFGSDTVLDRGIQDSKDFSAFQFNAAQRIESELRISDKFASLNQQLADTRAEIAECCCEMKLGISEVKGDILSSTQTQTRLLLEQDSRNAQAKISGLETQLAIAATHSGHGHGNGQGNS